MPGTTTRSILPIVSWKASYDNLESLKQTVSGQQSLMKPRCYSSDSATKVSFIKISKASAKNGKPFSDGEITNILSCCDVKMLIFPSSLDIVIFIICIK